MRIAIFTETYIPYISGLASNITVLKMGLLELGHEVLIVTANPETTEHYMENGILYCPAKASLNHYGFEALKSKNLVLEKFIEQFNPDIIHIFTDSPVGLLGVSYATRFDLPAVFSMYSYYNNYLQYEYSKFLLPVKRIQYRDTLRRIVDACDVIVSPSKKALPFLSENGLKRDVRIILSGVDMAKFNFQSIGEPKIKAARQKLRLAEKETGIIFAGPLHEEKNAGELLHNWAKVISTNDRLRLIIVGDGPAYDSLTALSSELGIADQVTFTGAMDYESMPACFACCDAYVSASESEMMSAATFEAIACGLPAVLKFDTYNNSQIKEGVNGFIYKDAEKMGEILKKIGALDTEGKRILKKLVCKSVQSLSPLNHAKCMVNVYEEAAVTETSEPPEEWNI